MHGSRGKRGAATAHLATEDRRGEDAKGQGLVAPDAPGRLVKGSASQLDAEGCLMGGGEVDLGVMPALSRPAGGRGQPQLCDAEEERYVKIQADPGPKVVWIAGWDRGLLPDGCPSRDAAGRVKGSWARGGLPREP